MDDNEKETQELKQRAESGDANAMLLIGWAYQGGINIQKDKEKAVEWFIKSTEKGNSRAMLLLAKAYQDGEGVQQNDEKAVECLKKGAETGDSTSMYFLGLAYRDGKGVHQDSEKAVDCFIKSAEKGSSMAMLCLGWAYQDGEGVQQDNEKALNWFMRAIESGDLTCIFMLGLYYEYYTHDNQKAVECYQNAASEGHLKSRLRLMGVTPIASKLRIPRAIQKEAFESYFNEYFPFYKRFNEKCATLGGHLKCLNAFFALMKDVVTLENEHFYQDQDKNGLTHYTSQIVLDAVLGGRKSDKPKPNTVLRLYMSAYLNDPTEGKYFLDTVFDDPLLSSAKPVDLERIRYHFQRLWVDDEKTSHLSTQMYSISLSKVPDGLDLWRAYGKDYHGRVNGVAITIPYETLKNFQTEFTQGIDFRNNFGLSSEGLELFEIDPTPFLLYEVRYGAQAIDKMWRKLGPRVLTVLDEIKKTETSEQDKHELNHAVVLSLMRLSYLYKHEAYASEQEVRAIRIGSFEDDPQLDQREPARLYFDSPHILFQDAGSKITLGPQMSLEERTALLWEIRMRLSKFRLSEKVSVGSSQIPFR